MTIVLESWKSADGLNANLQQEKYCACYQLDVFRFIDNGPLAQSVFRGNYSSKKTARQALKRFADTWEKE